VAAFVTVFISYWVYNAIYNLYFHPLAKFPGPRWAAASYLAEFYYDVLQGGQYFKKVIEMHEEYGPLVRINPHELSFNDPFFYDKVYSGSGQKRDKDRYQTVQSGLPSTGLTTVDHELHRQRRGYISNLFSKKAISSLEPVIQSKVHLLVEKLKEAHNKGEKLAGVFVFGALTCDVVSHFAYGESFNELEKPGFPCEIEKVVRGLLLSYQWRRFFPATDTVLNSLPGWMLTWLNPEIIAYLKFDDRITEYSNEALKKNSSGPPAKAQTLFDALTSPEIPAHERTLERLKNESSVILLAGLDTTARFLTIMVCYLVTYPHVLETLRAELGALAEKGISKPTWTQLEALPYLTAFINESLRYRCYVTGRFSRVPLQPLPYKEWVIPAHTSINGMPHLLNKHPEVFPDPDSFRPERWIEASARGEHLEKYLVTFTKGSRICLGLNLAYAELYLTVAALVQNFDLELVDSSVEDIIPYRDFGLAFNEKYDFGVDFKVKRVLSV